MFPIDTRLFVAVRIEKSFSIRLQAVVAFVGCLTAQSTANAKERVMLLRIRIILLHNLRLKCMFKILVGSIPQRLQFGCNGDFIRREAEKLVKVKVWRVAMFL